MRVRPKNVSWRRLIGRASRRTHSSRTLDGLHGGGIEHWEVVAWSDVAVAYVWARIDDGRLIKPLTDVPGGRSSAFMMDWVHSLASRIVDGVSVTHIS